MDNVGWSVQLNGMNESLYKTQIQKIRRLWMILSLVSAIVIANQHSFVAVLIACEGNLYMVSAAYPEL
jgi:hypothetical protein